MLFSLKNNMPVFKARLNQLRTAESNHKAGSRQPATDFTESHSITTKNCPALPPSAKVSIGTSFEGVNGKLIRPVQERRGGNHHEQTFVDSTILTCVPGALRGYGPGAAAEGLPGELSIGAANNFAPGEPRQLI